MTNTLHSRFSGSSPYTFLQKSGELFTFAWLIEEDHPHLDGHFDSWPIVPGATQVGAVMDVLEICMEKKVRLVEVKKAKFMAMIQPTLTLTISLQWNDKQDVAWEIKDATKTYSKGILCCE
jgi:3-hydroxymyristoyl/3-hydroxydecanoyl-(acyl carrier protein) dehydratase